MLEARPLSEILARGGVMKDSGRRDLLERLDHHRTCLGQPGTVVREFSPDRSECRILKGQATPARVATTRRGGESIGGPARVHARMEGLRSRRPGKPRRKPARGGLRAR